MSTTIGTHEENARVVAVGRGDGADGPMTATLEYEDGTRTTMILDDDEVSAFIRAMVDGVEVTVRKTVEVPHGDD